MSFYIASLPIHHYIWVDRSYIRRNGAGFERAVWFALVSPYARVFGCSVMLECGAVFRSLPPQAISFRAAPEPVWTVKDAQLFDCYSTTFTLVEYSFLREMRVTTGGKQGVYLFTCAFVDDGYTRAPDQSKEFSFIALDNGRLSIQPTNKTLFQDLSFTVDTGVPTDLLTQTTVWSCE